MLPVICKLGPLTVYSYGLMLAVSVVLCSALLSRDAKPYGFKSEQIFDLIFWCVAGGLIGARIFYVFLNFHFYRSYPMEIIMLQRGGLAWQGALVLGTLTGLFYVHRKRYDVFLVLDLASPYMALGQAIGRLGCFLNGCCYGLPVSWGIYFPLHDARLHPTQLYDAAGLFLIFLLLKKFQNHATSRGTVFALYLILAPLLRFVVEFFRADHTIVGFGLSLFQLVSAGLILGGLVFFMFLKTRNEKISQR